MSVAGPVVTIAQFTVPSEPQDEAQRLAVIRSYGLDRAELPPDAELDAVIARVAQHFAAPIVLISIITADQQCFRACIGLDVSSTPRSISFCGHAILETDPLIVPDATVDPRFAGNPLVLGPPYIRSYAGVPLISPEGQAIGTLCVIDTEPRVRDAAATTQLVAFGAAVMARLNHLRSL